MTKDTTHNRLIVDDKNLHPIAFDRSGADIERVADRRAGSPVDDKVEHLHLTRAQPVKPRAKNLHRLLLSPPLGQQTTAGWHRETEALPTLDQEVRASPEGSE